MAAPILTNKKFYIIKPWGGENQIKNPRFDMPDGKEDWAASGAGVTIENSSDEQRFGAYSMKVNTATNEASAAYYAGLSVTKGATYTFSCYVKGVAGQAMRVFISNVGNTIKGTTQFTATGYWQRVQVTVKADDTKTDWYAAVSRDATASTAAYYVDGAQFELAGSATTLMSGYTKGCRWTGAVRNSSSIRDANSTEGGWIVDLESYCHVVQAVGLGHGDWNQILTKMTSGGDMYQTYTRKSRQFSIVVDFLGNSLGEIEANRKAVIDLIRPDAFEGQERIIRYQGVDVNGVEATNPIDIRCIPLPATLTDTPDLPTYQRAVLNFAIPSGLLDGAYNEGAVLDFHADFAAEYIVKRDPNGNWCEWNSGTSDYDPLITGLNGAVYCMAQGPDGKIYAGGLFTDAGGTAEADYLARWDPVLEKWEAVGIPNTGTASITYVKAIAFDAAGNLYVGGQFTDFANVANADYFAKWDGSNWSAVGSGIDASVNTIAISSSGIIYIGGAFATAGGNSDCNRIAYYDSSTSNWNPLSTGLNNIVLSLSFAPNSDLYISGAFTDAAYPYLCKWNGSAFSAVGTAGDINQECYVINFDNYGNLYAGGSFTDAGDVANADYIAKWNGSSWSALGTGLGGAVRDLKMDRNSNLIACGLFNTAGGLTLTDRVAVWANGAWMPLDIDLPGTAAVYSILPALDGSIYIGGVFSSASSSDNASCAIVSNSLSTIGVTSASANTYPYMQVTGPGTLGSITNWSTGKSIMFDGLTLQAGETIALSFDPLNLQFKGAWDGRGNLMRYVIAGSDYGDFHLVPGANYLSLYMTGTTANSGATIAWVPKFWGLDGALL